MENKSRVMMLYAENSEMDILGKFLDRVGYAVDRTAQSEDALKLAGASPYDMIVIDYGLKGEDACEACKKLKDNPASMYIPVLFVTHETGHGDRIAALDAGADDILNAPIDTYEVVARMRSFRRISVRAKEVLRKELMIDTHNKLLRRIIGSYVSPEIADDLVKNPEKISAVGGETRQVTVMFADIRNFTAFSASHDPKEVVSMLNEIFEEMSTVVFKYKGTLDNFMGDCMMAFWGAPQPMEEHAHMAVCCANEMQERMAAIRNGWEKDEYYTLGLGIGINTGPVVVGNIGHHTFKKFTAIGSTVNMASRLETQARRNCVLLSDATRVLVADRIITEAFMLDIRGYAEKVKAYSLLKVKKQVKLDEVA
ncbi:MAG: response regulator [Nitrospirae bacterium]|nr:response regulator [Nitrospirota bacterium]MBI5696484.1 response regulator [Nitrospirota bacterium]